MTNEGQPLFNVRPFFEDWVDAFYGLSSSETLRLPPPLEKVKEEILKLSNEMKTTVEKATVKVAEVALDKTRPIGSIQDISNGLDGLVMKNCP